MHSSSPPAPALRRPPGPDAVLDAAVAFLHHFAAENPGAGDPRRRIAEVTAEIERHGTYEHTPEELSFGARVAWRNAARCIGRPYWNNLIVRDLRHVEDPDEVAEQCFEHLRLATNGGRIRPVISVFAPDIPRAHRARGQARTSRADRLELNRPAAVRLGDRRLPPLLRPAGSRPPPRLRPPPPHGASRLPAPFLIRPGS